MLKRRLGLFAAVLTLVLSTSPTASAQTCFSYVNTPATAPIRCVEQGDLSTACSWDGDCHDDGDLSDCCTSIPGPAQSVLQMHSAWHACFGSIGDSDGNNPPMRGNRWYAFHRQIEIDYNLWRESGNFCNPTAGSPQGCKIESVDWCPNMLLPYGFNCDLASAGTGCGSQSVVVDNSTRDCNPAAGSTDPCRQDLAPCPGCQAFPQCLFVGGAGPGSCPGAPGASCQGTGVSFPSYNDLADFKTVEEVTTLLDSSFHGNMHGAVGSAGPCLDINNSGCSVRDPMFWRLHKAIDDVVRAWQGLNAADVMVVVDRSGSMNELDAAGSSKLDAALEAADLFADLMEDTRPDGQTNRIGVVSYASNANDAGRNLAPINAGPTLRDPGQPFPNVLSAIGTAGGSGCTGIGGGVQAALDQICPGGNCSSLPDPQPAGTNRRKSVLLLTDGIENVPPCLQSAGAAGPTCGGQCFGAQLNSVNLYDTQVCAVGFGDAGSLNGDLLTLFAERQGGIYMQNPSLDPDGEWIDLKDFFAKCFGQLTDEFLGLDPKGLLAAGEPSSEVIEYSSCGDGKLTFVGGWKTPVEVGDLRLLVHAPNGDLVRPGPAVETSTQPTWDFARVRPAAGATGVWQAHLVRRHTAFVNGFTTDSFARPDEGVALVRREIQRLCPDGCKRVLYFEDKTLGDSAYRKALSVEASNGLLGAVTATDKGAELARLLRRDWDLLVYAHQEGEAPEPYDGQLAEKLCGGQRAILTDTRGRAADSILKCAGAAYDGSRNHRLLEVDPALKAARLDFANPGHPVWSYGLRPAGTVAQARLDRQGAGIVTRTERGEEQRWFVDVLVRGLNKLEASKPVSHFKTGSDLLPSVRISPFTLASGGFDRVDARVEIERPLLGLGTLLARSGLAKEQQIGEERLDPRAATIVGLEKAHRGPIIPTKTDVYPLFDDGTRGDLVANNHYWSAQIPNVAGADGMYRYRYILDLEKNGCKTRRELTQSVFVEVGVDPTASGVKVTPQSRPATGYDVSLVPRDRLGNLWGPGRAGAIQCRDADGCRCDATQAVDHGDGSYVIPIQVKAGTTQCRVDAFGTTFDLSWNRPAASCAALLKSLDSPRIEAGLRNKLRLRVTAVCDQLTTAQGDLSVASVRTGATLAEVLHEVESHAGPELPAAEVQELKRRVEELTREGGLTLQSPHSHH
jgi:hypothetical protein